MENRVLTAEDALKRAIEQRDALDREIEVAERAIAEFAARKAQLTQEIENQTGHVEWLRKLLAPTQEEEVTAPQGRRPAEGQTSTSIINEKSLALARASEHPIPIGDLFAILTADGVVILGQNPAGNLSSKLSQIPGQPLVHLRNFGWWPRERPYAAAGYYPGGPADGKPGAAKKPKKGRRASNRKKGAPPKPKSAINPVFDEWALNVLSIGGIVSTQHLKDQAIATGGLGINESTDLRSLVIRLLALKKRGLVLPVGKGLWGTPATVAQPRVTVHPFREAAAE
jgi:hypothetical protein